MLRRGGTPRTDAELYSVGATPHESKAPTASQRGVLPHRATNAARNGLSGTHTWPCAGKRTTYRPACGRAVGSAELPGPQSGLDARAACWDLSIR
jgi:hypothetical protein